MKTDKELLDIWKEKTENKTYQGEKDFLALTTEEKSRLFELIKNGEYTK
jgi:hypothetical protein